MDVVLDALLVGVRFEWEEVAPVPAPEGFVSNMSLSE